MSAVALISKAPLTVEQWKGTGMFEGLSPSAAEEVAIMMNSCLQEVADRNYSHAEAETVLQYALPVIRRIHWIVNESIRRSDSDSYFYHRVNYLHLHPELRDDVLKLLSIKEIVDKTHGLQFELLPVAEKFFTGCDICAEMTSLLAYDYVLHTVVALTRGEKLGKKIGIL